MSQDLSETPQRPAEHPSTATPVPVSTVAAVVVAAGQGLRAGQPLPKQFAPWRGKPVIRHSVEALASAGVKPILVVIPQGAETLAAEALSGIEGILFTNGGETRQESVRLGLEVLVGGDPDFVLIHDAARPLLPAAVIGRLLAALDDHEGAIPVLPVADSLAHAETSGDGGKTCAGSRPRRPSVSTEFSVRTAPGTALPMPETMPRSPRLPAWKSRSSKETKPCTS
jgi:2-C-methyl-D-erythritol 4-phosphate cytidylyltransferase/2-C-methyl-D-erythritol 2,4-cyclodiphosphate synthase